MLLQETVETPIFVEEQCRQVCRMDGEVGQLLVEVCKIEAVPVEREDLTLCVVVRVEHDAVVGEKDEVLDRVEKA